MIERLESVGRSRDDLVVAPRIDVSELTGADSIAAWSAAGADQLIVAASGHDLGEHREALQRVAGLA